jgi:hypothetical protein
MFYFNFDSFLVFTLWSRRKKDHPGNFKDFDELKLEELLDVEVVTAMVEEKQTFEKTVLIFLSDTGCGIPQDRLDKTFDPLYATKNVGEGTGLGFSVCYGIIGDHQGEITVESEEGKGSILKIYLPIENEFEEYETKQKIKTRLQTLSKEDKVESKA